MSFIGSAADWATAFAQVGRPVTQGEPIFGDNPEPVAHTQPEEPTPADMRPASVREVLDRREMLVLPSQLERCLREGWRDTGERRQVGLSQPVCVLVRPPQP